MALLSRFPFSDAKETAAFTCCHITEQGAPILYVSHDAEDGAWQFLCGGTHDFDDARLVSLYEIWRSDKSVSLLAGMPCGCCAQREKRDTEWSICRKG